MSDLNMRVVDCTSDGEPKAGCDPESRNVKDSKKWITIGAIRPRARHIIVVNKIKDWYKRIIK